LCGNPFIIQSSLSERFAGSANADIALPNYRPDRPDGSVIVFPWALDDFCFVRYQNALLLTISNQAPCEYSHEPTNGIQE
jgi:hypothetical protein